MKTKLKIVRHEDKTGTTGKDYTRFFTDNGWMSAFDSELIKDLKEHEGKVISVETEEKESRGKVFYNIVKFYGAIAPGLDSGDIDKSPTKPADNEFFKKREEKSNVKVKADGDKKDSIIVGTSVAYAKDLCCAEIAAGKDFDIQKLRTRAEFFVKLQKELNAGL